MSTPEPTATDEPARSQRRQRLLILGAVVLVLGVAYAAYQFLHGRFYESTDDAYVAADVMQITSEVAGTVSRRARGRHAARRARPGAGRAGSRRCAGRVGSGARPSWRARCARSARCTRRPTACARRCANAELLLDAARADVKRREQAGDGGAVSAEELQHARDQVAQLQAALTATEESLRQRRAPRSTTRRSKRIRRCWPPRRAMHEAALNLNRTSHRRAGRRHGRAPHRADRHSASRPARR